MMLPDGFVKRIRTQDYINSEALLKALDEPSPVSIRINSSKWQITPAGADPVPWCSTGWYLQSRPSYTLDPLFHSGCYYPQEASGMFLEQVFRQVAGNGVKLRVLDLCGAPGGKSTHLSSMIGRNGFLVANEVIRSRASILAENITRWGIPNTMVTQSDPAAFTGLKGFFDVILVDAPCSGEGMFRDPVARSEWSEENARLCSERQKRILMDVWPALREDGILIYSTCTFNPAENEDNVKWLIGMVDASTVHLNVDIFQGICEIDSDGVKCYGFYPDKIKGEGLFFSVIRKNGTPETGRKTFRYSNQLRVTRDDLASAGRMTNFTADCLIRNGDDVTALPWSISETGILLQNLRVIKAGIKIFTLKKKDHLPSHELALSAGLKDGAFPYVELAHEQAIAYLKRGNPEIRTAPSGWFLIGHKGINLGFANNIGSRINNYFPVEWRIRMNIPENSEMEILNWEGTDHTFKSKQ
jgi:16S rRNA C967 or C1407 C5-methylase (RsmB/RsmF family)/NOL1/NOP2/fmu family ribosome biogenesis protein